MTRVLAMSCAALVAVTGLVGCSVAPEAPPSQASPSVAAPVGPMLPPRPREIPVAGMNACSVVPPKVLAEAGVPPRGTNKPPELPGVSLCQWDTFPATPDLVLTVYTVPAQDTASYLRFPDAVQTSVAGFGAVEGVKGIVSLPPEWSCILRIDVAPGQGLWVSYDNTVGDLPGVNHELMCAKARTAAEGIIESLLIRAR